MHQFDPVPPITIGEAQELKPISTRPVTELLHEADNAFKEANAAQERGDHEAALRQYSLMLELLLEADIDPAIFYNLRGEFNSVIDQTNMETRLSSAAGADLGTPFQPTDGYAAFQIPFPLPPEVIVEIEEIQNRYPKNFQSGLDRSHKYRQFVWEEFKKEGLPPELLYVAMIESLFQSQVTSRSGAGGMWQFMKVTGQRYHLRIDSYVDERYDWQSSTRAGVQYLQDLHDYFDGSWALAITAYNMGEGGLERAIASNGDDRNFWRLINTPPASDRIRMETKKYYPRFLAYLIVTSNPERYGFKNNPCAPENVVPMPVDGMFALDDLDAAMGYPPGTLAALNPDLVKEVTPPSGGYHVSVPAQDTEKFASALQDVKSRKPVYATHMVCRGETINKIAANYGVSVGDIQKLNNLRSNRALQANQVIKLPAGASLRNVGGPPAEETVEAKAPPANNDNPKVVSHGERSYTVRRGDTLNSIATSQGVTTKELQVWNSMGRSTRINVGQRLKTGEGAPAAEAASEPVVAATDAPVQEDVAEEDAFHTVRAGEYPSKIAAEHDLSLEGLLALNDLTAESTIKVGQPLRIKAGAKSAEKVAVTPASEAKTYEVVKGDTLFGIAAKCKVAMDDLCRWNKLAKNAVLQLGQKLTIYASAAPASKEAAEAKAITHTVSSGQNLTVIARHYGVDVNDLIKWNNWNSGKVLKVGEKVIVYKQ